VNKVLRHKENYPSREYPFVSKRQRDRAQYEYSQKKEFLRRLLWKEQTNCFYCDKVLRLNNYNIDHKIPLCRGGNNEPANLVLTCGDCNDKKGWLTAEEFLNLKQIEGII